MIRERNPPMDPMLVAVLVAGGTLIVGLLGALLGGWVVARRQPLHTPIAGSSTIVSSSSIDAHEELLRDALETLAERVARLERLERRGRTTTDPQRPKRALSSERVESLTARAIPIPPSAPIIVETRPVPPAAPTISTGPRRSREEIRRLVVESAARGQDSIAIAQFLDIDVGEVDLILRLHRGV
jgi:hypothetical protein